MRFELFRWDAEKMRSLPKVDSSYPMVAFCAFEASLNYAEGGRAGVQFMGSGQSIEGARTRSISHTMFSKFFQLDGKLSAQQLLTEVCEKVFRPGVELYANRDFSRAVTEFYAHQHPGNECKQDSDCQAWHSENFSKPLRKITVARCTLARTGVHRCEVRARENGSCPMYWDGARRVSVPRTHTLPKRFYPKATGGPLEFDCDEKQGLSCQSIVAPRILLNVPVWKGKARCLRKSMLTAQR